MESHSLQNLKHEQILDLTRGGAIKLKSGKQTSVNVPEERKPESEEDEETSLGAEVFNSDSADEKTDTDAATQISTPTSSSCEDPFRSVDSDVQLVRRKKEPHLLDRTLSHLNKPWIIVLSIVGLLGLCAATVVLTYVSHDETKSKITALNGVVASDSQICSTVAKNLLLQGGSAIDAAVAGTLCLGVVKPYASGLGGGGYMLVYLNGTSTAEVIDFREMAPAAATEYMFDAPNDISDPTTRTPNARYIAVPGELHGLAFAHSKYGKLPWREVVVPAAEIARNGFLVDALLAQRIKENLSFLQSAANNNLTSIFAPNNVPLTEGQMLRRPDLAETLFEIAQYGPDAFYLGKIGQKLIKDIRAAGGIITMEDLNNYTTLTRDCQKTFYHGISILTAPPSSAGGVGVCEILNILELYNIPREGPSLRALLLTIESFKHAFSDISVLGDPAFTNATSIANLLSQKDYSAKIRRKIQDEKTFPTHYYGIIGAPLSDMGSSSLVVVDQNRNAVAMTSSINYPFGSGIYSPSTGIILNNQMASFNSDLQKYGNASETSSVLYWDIKSKGNSIAPFKRPLSSITPTILLRDEEVYLVVSASAGTETGQAIITSVVQTIIDVAGYNLDPLRAVARSRCHHQLIPNKLYVEYDFPPDLIAGLKQAGHDVVQLGSSNNFLGSVQMIVRGTDGLLYAASDPRTKGGPAGY